MQMTPSLFSLLGRLWVHITLRRRGQFGLLLLLMIFASLVEIVLPLITFNGFAADNSLRKLGDISFWADSHAYNVVEMTRSVWLLSLADKLVEDAFPSGRISKLEKK